MESIRITQSNGSISTMVLLLDRNKRPVAMEEQKLKTNLETMNISIELLPDKYFPHRIHPVAKASGVLLRKTVIKQTCITHICMQEM